MRCNRNENNNVFNSDINELLFFPKFFEYVWKI